MSLRSVRTPSRLSETQQPRGATRTVLGGTRLAVQRTRFHGAWRYGRYGIIFLVVVAALWNFFLLKNMPGIPTFDHSPPIFSHTSSTEKQVPPRQNCHYHLSQYGEDGIGHQMEAKLSCWATALALNWTYVHQPVKRVDHGQDPHRMESLFGLSASISKLLQNYNAKDAAATLYNYSSMQIKPRTPLPWLGHCNEESWFDQKLRQNASECTNTINRIEVYSADNCWDFFWCHLKKIPSAWHDTIVPTLRQTILEGLQRSQNLPAFSSDRSIGILQVAMHMRMGDAGDRKANFDWCRGVVLQLLRAAQQQSKSDSSVKIKRLHVMIHTDAESEFITERLKLVESDALRIEILGQNNVNATIERFLYDMLTCQILIASDSSLSMTAALLRRVHDNINSNGFTDRVTVLHPEVSDRPRMLWLGWEMVRPEQLPPLSSSWQRCAVAPPPNVHAGCQKWEKVDASFWNKLVTKSLGL